MKTNVSKEWLERRFDAEESQETEPGATEGLMARRSAAACSPSSDTPETDAAECDGWDGTHSLVRPDFARKLERQRNAALEELKNAAARIYKMARTNGDYIAAERFKQRAESPENETSPSVDATE